MLALKGVPMSEGEFLIPMEGLHNLRAVEGYETASGRRMRGGRLYRSGAWERMSDRDRGWFAEHVTTVLDLRHRDEVTTASQASLGEPPARVVHHSIFHEDVPMAVFTAELNGLHGPGISSARYLHYLEAGAGDRFAQALELLAEGERYPVLINCTAGKDRTGILVALVMELLGVDDETIGAEYERSNASIEGLIAYLAQIGRHPEGSPEEIRARMATPADKILGFLEGVRERHGSVRGMLSEHGLRDDTVAALEEQLLE
jgi:protein-tyrosine phosphatase